MDPPELSGNYNSPVINKSIEYRYLILGVIFIVVGYLAFKPTVDKYNEERQARLINEFEDGDVTQSNANIYFKLYGGFIKAGLLLLVYYMYDALLKHLIGSSSIGHFILVAATFVILGLYDSAVLSADRPDNFETPKESPLYNALKIMTALVGLAAVGYTVLSKAGDNSAKISLFVIGVFAIWVFIGIDTFFREESYQLGMVDRAKYALTPWAQIISGVAFAFIWFTQQDGIKKMLPKTLNTGDATFSETFSNGFGVGLFILWILVLVSLIQHIREGRLTVTYDDSKDQQLHRYYVYDFTKKEIHEMYQVEGTWTWISDSDYRKNWDITIVRINLDTELDTERVELIKTGTGSGEKTIYRENPEVHASETHQFASERDLTNVDGLPFQWVFIFIDNWETSQDSFVTHIGEMMGTYRETEEGETTNDG